jgi:ornithine decarboxylase
LVSLDDIWKKHNSWLQNLPDIKPFYAVKCNDCPSVLSLLAYLGTGFDCASRKEIENILQLNVSPDRIIFAQPCKEAFAIKYASENCVDKMTFDNDFELIKIKKYYSKAR